MSKPDEFVLQITFASMFSTDTLSLDINDCSIVKDQRLETSSIDGVTDFQATITHHNDGYRVSILNGKDVFCNTGNDGYFNLTVFCDGEQRNYQINPVKGKYLIFYKEEKVYYRQYLTPPVFD